MRNLNFSVKDNSIGWLEWDQSQSSVNLLSSDFMKELAVILKQIEKSQIKVLVFISKKLKNFCAGVDIREIQRQKNIAEDLNKAHDLFCRFENLGLSKISAIRGSCLGGGLELALCCDYRLLADSPETLLGLPEVHLGLIPGFGGCVRLPQLIGLKSALSLILTGKKLNSLSAYKSDALMKESPLWF